MFCSAVIISPADRTTTQRNMLLPTQWSRNNYIFWDDNSPCVAMRTDSSSSRIIVFADNPLPNCDVLLPSRSQDSNDPNCTTLPFETTGDIYYFEIEVLSNVNDGGSSEVSVGIAPVDSQDRGHMDTYNSFQSAAGSIVYSSSGVITRGGCSNTAIRFGTRDIIGCGCEVGGHGNVFFTCNGKLIPEPHIDLRGGFHSTQKSYFPAVELVGIGTSVRANFGEERFQFSLRNMIRWAPMEVPPPVFVPPPRQHQPTTTVARPVPVVGRAQTHSFMSRISSQLSQPLFQHSRSDNDYSSRSGSSREFGHFHQSEDYMVAIASALSLEPSDAVVSSVDTWTDADATQAEEALSLLQELLKSHSSQDTCHGLEAISALCDTLEDLQRRMRLSIDKSPENESLLELNDMTTELLAEVAEIIDMTDGKDICEPVSLRATAHAEIPPQPSLVSLMYMLRRGGKDEVLTSVRQILSLCHGHPDQDSVSAFECPGSYSTTVVPRAVNDIRVAGGLQTLVSTLLRCSDWPDVELHVSMAIGLLVAHETDWHILMKESHAVLSSLQILLLRKDDIHCTENTGPHDDKKCKKENLRCVVSLAVKQFCVLLCDECRKTNMKSSSVSSVNAEILPESPLNIHRSLPTNSKHPSIAPVTDEAYLSRTLATLTHIIQTLCVDDADDGNSVSASKNQRRQPPPLAGRTRAASHSMGLDVSASAPKVDGGIIHSRGGLIGEDPLARSQSTPDLREVGCCGRSNSVRAESATSLNDAAHLPCESGSAYNATEFSIVMDEVVILCSHALCNLCQIEDFRSSLVAGDILSLLVTWLKKSTAVMAYCLAGAGIPSGHHVYELVGNVTLALAAITAADGPSLPSPSPFHKHSNYTIGWIDAQVMAVELPTAIVSFFGLFTEDFSFDLCCPKDLAHHFQQLGVVSLATSLISLVSRQQNRLSLLNYGVPDCVVGLLEVAVARIKSIQEISKIPVNDESSEGCNMDYSAEDLQQQSSYFLNTCGQFLDLLSYFLSDNIAEIPSTTPPSGVADKPPPMVMLILDPEVIRAVMYLFSLPSCMTRLHAVRVLSMIVEWQYAMELLNQEGVSIPLAVLLEDANERSEYDLLDNGESPSADSGAQVQEGRPLGNRRVYPAPPVKAVTQVMTEAHVLEETMRACYSLAHLCHAKLSYALQFFENGLMTIMLRTVRNGHIEVQRQAMRCISGMCPVLSLLTPGAHPSLMIASLKSETALLNPTRSQSGSLMETRAMAKKLHGNVIDFVNALRVSTHALSSPSMLIKLEALRGISHLAKDDHLRVGIVEGPLPLIITLLLDPQCETELKQLAESVLVNIGFVGGREDLDVVGNDHHLLSEWFYIRRSLRLQKSCSELLNQWVNGLFRGCDVAEKRAKQRFIAELGREGLAENVDDDDDSLFLHFPEGVDVDIRDTVDLVGLSVVTHVIEKIMVRHKHGIDIDEIQNSSFPLSAHKQSADLREALLLQFTHLFDAWKLLRYSHIPLLSLKLPDNCPFASSNEWIKDKSGAYFNFNPGGSAMKRSGHITERFFAFMSFCTGKGAQRDIDEEGPDRLEAPPGRQPKSQPAMERDDDFSLNLSNYDYSADDLDDGLNIPPGKVSECLDLFYPSKLHQALVCDLFSIGKMQDSHTRQPLAREQPFSTPHRGGPSQQVEGQHFRVPEPKQFRSLILPSRRYFSFAREGRVLKKILDDVANLEKNDLSVEASSIGGYADIHTLWALSFRDSVFHGEFIMTLVNTLRSLPQVSSLSFVCKSPQGDSELGYFGGNVPSTVRFLSFQNALSSASIDTLCTYLRAQNVSFTRNGDKAAVNNDDCDPSSKGLNQGLVGLSISHSALAAEDVSNICDLLRGGSRDEVAQERNSDSVKKNGADFNEATATPATRGAVFVSASRRLYGLLYLDLSHNKLSDEQCSDVLHASMDSPLEGLELRGNYVHRGLYFCPVLHKYLASPQCQLVYLGVSANCFINATFRSVLDCCQADNSLTSLDLSYNDLTSSEKNCIRVREFLKVNITLRSLNLSHNRFTNGMTRIFHLALLENDYLILLRLDGNISLNEREMYLVRGKLKANRDRYVEGSSAASVAAFSDSKTERDFRGQRHSASSTQCSFLPFKSVEKTLNFEDSGNKQGEGAVNGMSESVAIDRSQHDRTLSDCGNGEKGDISNLFSSTQPVVATEVTTIDDDVPVSSAFFPLSDSGGNALSVAAVPPRGQEKEHPPSLRATQTICVLFSAPLAWTDTRNQLHPIQTLDYPGERETLIQAFREASRDIGVRFDFATTDTLRTALSLGVKVLHFSGHGHPHCLNFEDGRSGLQFVTMDALRSLCQAGGNQLEFVFVSACHSRRAGEAFVGAGVPHVVCVTVEAQLLDAAAMAFTRAFYLALAVGRSVSHAFDIGKQAVFTSPYVPNSSVEGEKFLLLPEDSNHDSPVFEAKSVNQWPIPGSSLKGLTCGLIDNSYLPRTPEDFEGREVDMYSTIRILLSRRLVTIVGENGVGKTSVAIAVCSYLCERRKFENGVIFVRLRGVVTHEDFLLALSQAIKSGSHELASRFVSLNDEWRKDTKGDTPSSVHSIRDQEEILLKFLAPLKSLIVLANISGLLTAPSSETSTDLKMFLSRLFDRCSFIKALTTGTEVIGMTGFGTVEHVVSLGPLSLYSSLRLFARLSPALATAAQKVKFVKTLLILDQANVTLESRELSSAAAKILYMLGGGHPSKIVKIACESSSERIGQMLTKTATKTKISQT